jgi:hypothetical protein
MVAVPYRRLTRCRNGAEQSGFALCEPRPLRRRRAAVPTFIGHSGKGARSGRRTPCPAGQRWTRPGRPAHRTARQIHLDRCLAHRELRVSALNRHTWRNNVGFATLSDKETRESNAQKASASAWRRSPCAMRHRSIVSICRCTSEPTSVASGPISFRGSQISR